MTEQSLIKIVVGMNRDNKPVPETDYTFSVEVQAESGSADLIAAMTD
ncbi:MAG TPA: hypothetical protein VGJ28_10600 [Micromonosporaceae bacterium]